MEAGSPFSAHHRPLLPPPFFLPSSRLSAAAPPHSTIAPLTPRLYRPAPAVSVDAAVSMAAIKFSAPSYSHSIARLAGIQTELEVEEDR